MLVAAGAAGAEILEDASSLAISPEAMSVICLSSLWTSVVSRLTWEEGVPGEVSLRGGSVARSTISVSFLVGSLLAGGFAE